MPDEDKTFSGSFVLDLRIWWRQVHTLYWETSAKEEQILIEMNILQPVLWSVRVLFLSCWQIS